MVFSASTLLLTVDHESLPKPFSQTVAPFRPTTTDAPGYPPALIPRWTTRSMASRREEDIPTAAGALTGRPSLPCTSVRTVTMTLSTSHSFLHVGTQCARQSSVRIPIQAARTAHKHLPRGDEPGNSRSPIAIVIRICEFRATYFRKKRLHPPR